MKKLSLLLGIFSIIQLSIGQVYSPVVNYYFNGNPTYGVKIKTNIPFQHGLGMPTIILEGYNYIEPATINLMISWYVYNSDFTKYTISSSGGHTPTVKLVEEAGKIVVFIDEKLYYNRFTVRAYANGKSETHTMFEGWSVVDEAISGTNIVTVPYKNRFSGNVYYKNGIWNQNGKVGIGTTSPENDFTVLNRAGLNQAFVSFRSSSDNNRLFDFVESSSEIGVLRGYSNGNVSICLDTDGNSYFNSGGYFGIGTNSPQSLLSVNGIITAKEVTITMDNWSDFVFRPEYNLESIVSVEQYIKEHSRLPGIPPESEVLKNGIQLGEMNALLLQKIEELTLYVIDQNKRIKNLEKQNEMLLKLVN